MVSSTCLVYFICVPFQSFDSSIRHSRMYRLGAYLDQNGSLGDSHDSLMSININYIAGDIWNWWLSFDEKKHWSWTCVAVWCAFRIRQHRTSWSSIWIALRERGGRRERQRREREAPIPIYCRLLFIIYFYRSSIYYFESLWTAYLPSDFFVFINPNAGKCIIIFQWPRDFRLNARAHTQNTHIHKQISTIHGRGDPFDSILFVYIYSIELYSWVAGCNKPYLFIITIISNHNSVKQFIYVEREFCSG